MTTTKLSVYSIQKRQTGYGHWKITLDIELPKEELIDEDGEVIESEESGKISCISTDSRAIDGHDGADQALAIECLRDNDYDEDDFDLTTLDGGEDDEENIKNFYVVSFDTHKGQRFVDRENSDMGTDNEYNAVSFDTKEQAQSFIDGDKDAERLYLVEVEPINEDSE